jgi:hypothetical protein
MDPMVGSSELDQQSQRRIRVPGAPMAIPEAASTTAAAPPPADNAQQVLSALSVEQVMEGLGNDDLGTTNVLATIRQTCDAKHPKSALLHALGVLEHSIRKMPILVSAPFMRHIEESLHLNLNGARAFVCEIEEEEEDIIRRETERTAAIEGLQTEMNQKQQAREATQKANETRLADIDTNIATLEEQLRELREQKVSVAAAERQEAEAAEAHRAHTAAVLQQKTAEGNEDSLRMEQAQERLREHRECSNRLGQAICFVQYSAKALERAWGVLWTAGPRQSENGVYHGGVASASGPERENGQASSSHAGQLAAMRMSTLEEPRTDEARPAAAGGGRGGEWRPAPSKQMMAMRRSQDRCALRRSRDLGQPVPGQGQSENGV